LGAAFIKAGWQTKTVGEVCQLMYGKPLGDADRKPDGLYPVYGANGENDRTDKYYFDKSSIIVGRKGSAGEINLTETKFWPLDVTYFVTFDAQQYDLRFLYYLLTTLDLPSLAKGVKPGINRNEVYSQVVKITPLPEQQRIVGILDDALLFGELPKFFRDEDKLRAHWSLPDTPKKLLEGLAEKGFGKDQLAEMQKINDAENSDLFDVLAHVAFALQPISREERAGEARGQIYEHFSDKQQAFLDFVLAHYVKEGVEELEQEKLTKLLRLLYHDSIPDAVADLGDDIAEIRNLFSGFQRYLYQSVLAAS
jgi:hypothetical protein